MLQTKIHLSIPIRRTPRVLQVEGLFDLPPADVATLQPETALDALETTTHETGQAILRRLLQAIYILLHYRKRLEAAVVKSRCQHVEDLGAGKAVQG